MTITTILGLASLALAFGSKSIDSRLAKDAMRKEVREVTSEEIRGEVQKAVSEMLNKTKE